MAFRQKLVGLISKIGRDSIINNKKVNKFEVCLRHGSYQSSPVYDPNNKIDYEISKDPEEWKSVSRLLASKIIPDPKPKESYPSGWRPQSESAFKLPYFIRRTKNHMIPVYLSITTRGLRKTTRLLHIEGDIWALAKEIREYLGKTHKTVGLRVDEVGGKIVLRGDYVNLLLRWIESKGL